MRILVLDNGDYGGRIASWNEQVADNGVDFRTSRAEVPLMKLDIMFLHYTDFLNIYSNSDIFRFLQGLYADKCNEFEGASSSDNWVNAMIKLPNADEQGDKFWFETGSQCKNALFFSGGTDAQFTNMFKDVLKVLNNLEARVGYCYPVEVAQDRLRQILKRGDVTEEVLFGFEPRVEYSVELLQEFLPLDIALQFDNVTICKEQAESLVQRRAQCEGMLEKVYRKGRQVKDTSFNKSKELLAELFELTAKLQSSNDESDMARCFGYSLDSSQSRKDVRTSDLDDSGFHRKLMELRDVLLVREE